MFFSTFIWIMLGFGTRLTFDPADIRQSGPPSGCNPGRYLVAKLASRRHLLDAFWIMVFGFVFSKENNRNTICETAFEQVPSGGSSGFATKLFHGAATNYTLYRFSNLRVGVG